MRRRTPAAHGIEVTIGPHQARAGWRVLRVNFDSTDPEQERRIGEVLRVLHTARAPHDLGTNTTEQEPSS